MLVRALLAVVDERLRARLRDALDGSDVLIQALAGETAWASVAGRNADLVVIERGLLPEPAVTSVEVLRQAPESPEVLIVMPDGHPEERARLLAAGCRAVLAPSLSDASMAELLGAVTEERRLRDLDRKPPAPSLLGEPRLSDFVSESRAMQTFMDVVGRVVGTDATLLIEGETGVGKERLAKAIHAGGRRADAPFVAVNCAALPETLLESELFGHEEGAFTGATRARRGWFELAHGGTLFLDEIGEMPRALQTKLLRALQERAIQPLGAESLIPIDARLMAATNRDLEAAIEQGVFRSDLYYRLSVVTLTVPPLRERSEDIDALANSYVEYFAAQIGRDVLGVTPAALQALRVHDWPGNVRELMNVVERAVLLCRSGRIGVEDLPAAVTAQGPPASAARAADPAATDAWLGRPWKEVREEAVAALERAYLDALLRHTGGRVGLTARHAGMEPRSLHTKMRRHGLRKEDYR